ncbi:uncharacterized protein LOC143039389 [Oratosquilla oratoria]|uniref:uncharacterized protein LOC143039389 n=1 Tax=Oratosquilla oratoria TaxID=337810 RepID=UPI003F773F2F
MEIMAVTDLEGELSPLQRSRCNTWPLPHPDHYPSGEGTPPHHDWVDQHLPPHLHHQQPPPPPQPQQQQQQHQPNAAAGHFAMLHMPPHAHALPLHALAPAQYPSQGDPHADPHAAITPGGNGLPGEGALCPVGPGGGGVGVGGGGASDGGGCPSAVGGNKKSTARRNAWGGQSYADIITKAIQSSPEGRLTLAQIYDWVVQNISYFKDKGDSNSSAGWKVGKQILRTIDLMSKHRKYIYRKGNERKEKLISDGFLQGTTSNLSSCVFSRRSRVKPFATMISLLDLSAD